MTSAERLNEAVYRHRIMWTDLAARVMKNENMPKEDADYQVCRLIEKKGVSLPVAVALIDMIVEQQR
ncbi:hypothetical protein [Pseudorhodoplanes sp.]|uniref:hypothetical protein n=1 Tax=Pseudorhodoplanes sp. TaxID=1934341 RepID=UPI002D08DC11|nr:hypothetical protein [Pseudorhodoplanes sp.]HWV44094.1 hypothetical protein [Pseudorhodoplanes sp.]